MTTPRGASADSSLWRTIAAQSHGQIRALSWLTRTLTYDPALSCERRSLAAVVRWQPVSRQGKLPTTLEEGLAHIGLKGFVASRDKAQGYHGCRVPLPVHCAHALPFPEESLCGEQSRLESSASQ
jgi:hypothetical protein